MTGGRVRAVLAVLVTVVLGGAIVGIGQGGDSGGSEGSGSGTTAATGTVAGGASSGAEASGSGGQDAGASAVQALGVLGERGRRVFDDEGCGGCHRLADAGSNGRIGPDLDAVLTGQDEARIRQSIVDPQAEATPGFDGAQMPDRYGDQLSAEDLDALVKYLAAGAKG